MRVIEVFSGPVRAVAVSPDGRFLAATATPKGRFPVATGDLAVSVHDWATGERLWERDKLPAQGHIAFSPRGHLVFHEHGWLSACDLAPPGGLHRIARAPFSGGLAISSDGRTLVATRAGASQQVRLEKWELPGWRPAIGVDYWSPFTRLAFSPNGEHIAGISPNLFELRFGQSGGLNRREESPWEQYRLARERVQRGLRRGESLREAAPPQAAFLTFSRDSDTVIFGWDTEFRAMETRAGSVLQRIPSPGDTFADAVFLGSGQLLATVDRTPVMRLWSAESWGVVREYDWGAGGLTCVTATADGLAGVCGTDAGRVVVFDVDE